MKITFNRRNKNTLRFITASLLTIGLAACGDNDNNNDAPPVDVDVLQEFQVEVVNLTAGQPFSPIAVIVHTDGYSIFELGEPATIGLENLAESGDNSELISEATASTEVISTLSADAPLGPGSTETLTFTVNEDDLSGLLLSGVTMLVNTNDAITAVQDISLEDMDVGEVISLNTIGYDSGTEANSELIGTIPGPADGGEGFNSDRLDVADEVRMHSGVITSDDGLTVSRLTEVHRWDNPVSRIKITRTQ